MIPGWLDELEDDVTACLRARGDMSARELADTLNISETTTVSYICVLAARGGLTIERVSLPAEASRERRASGIPGRNAVD
jgi:predicted ArsR family transcriptional regulator